MAFQLLESSKNKENPDHICKLLAKSLWYIHDRGLHKFAILYPDLHFGFSYYIRYGVQNFWKTMVCIL